MTVDNPAVGAVTELKPEKFMFVIAVPTDAPANCSSTPEITPVSSAPEPTNAVAVIIPLAESIVIPDPTLIPDAVATLLDQQKSRSN